MPKATVEAVDSKGGYNMAIWDACTLEPSSVIRWFECHPGSAGWVQAVGSLLAIGFAIWLGRRQMKESRDQEEVRRAADEEALEMLLTPSVTTARADIERIEGVIAQKDYGLAIITPAIVTRDNAVRAMSFRPPNNDDLIARVGDLSLDARRAVLKLFTFVKRFNEFVAAELPNLSGNDERDKYKAYIDLHLPRIKKAAAETEKALGL
jgi:hypothetical protein